MFIDFCYTTSKKFGRKMLERSTRTHKRNALKAERNLGAIYKLFM